MNTIYIHDAGSGKLIIRKIPDTVLKSQGDYEEALRICAETNGMHFGDCDWGGVHEMSIEI
jgi:hypothetical protein